MATRLHGFQKIFSSSDASGGEVVQALAVNTNEKIYIQDLIISVESACIVTLTFGGRSLIFYFAANGGIAKSFVQPLAGMASSQGGISVETSVAVNISIAVTGFVAL